MNIFVVSPDPVECAHALDDVRLNKMILESAQMLCTALRYHGVSDSVLYRVAHPKHPCTLWTQETRANFRWLVRHALAMCKLYKKCRGRTHGCEHVIRHCSSLKMHIPAGRQTQFANATPYKFAGTHSSIFERYRQYMIDKWESDVITVTWSNRPIPSWYLEKKNGNS